MTGAQVMDLPEAEYHQLHNRASSTTLRKILRPGGPALVRWEQDHPVHRDAYDLGSVVHALVLGRGAQIVEIPADDWRTKAVKEARDEARAAGRVPLLSKDLARARACVAEIRAHPLASALTDPGAFIPERTVLWDADGVPCRAMVDAWPVDGPGRPIAWDLKTTGDIGDFEKSVVRYGYEQQADHYLTGLAAAGHVDCGFLFVVVDTAPPHLVRVVQLDEDLLVRGRARNSRALALWDECMARDEWPGFPQLDTITCPRWAREEEL